MLFGKSNRRPTINSGTNSCADSERIMTIGHHFLSTIDYFSYECSLLEHLVNFRTQVNSLVDYDYLSFEKGRNSCPTIMMYSVLVNFTLLDELGNDLDDYLHNTHTSS